METLFQQFARGELGQIFSDVDAPGLKLKYLKAMKWVQVNSRISDTTISRSGKTSANWTMRRRFFSPNPQPNSASNCLPDVRT